VIVMLIAMNKRKIEQDSPDTIEALGLNAELSNLQTEECIHLEDEFVDYDVLCPKENPSVD